MSNNPSYIVAGSRPWNREIFDATLAQQSEDWVYIENEKNLTLNSFQNIVPDTQEGEIVVFDRRTPEKNRIENIDSLDDLYDFILMLDAEGYPHAFLENENFRIEFTDAELEDDSVKASVKITNPESFREDNE